MKLKNYKKILIGVIIGLVISGATIYADMLFSSNQVSYFPVDSNWNVNNVESAITDLYDKILYGDATATDILSGKTAVVGGKKITGTNDSMNYGDATAADIKSGKTAVVKGEKITGTGSSAVSITVTLNRQSDSTATYNSGYTGYTKVGVISLSNIYVNSTCGNNCGSNINASINSSGTITLTVGAPYIIFHSTANPRATLILMK